MIYKLYEDSLTPAFKIAKQAHIKIGVIIGFHQFATYTVMSSMFYIGGLLI